MYMHQIILCLVVGGIIGLAIVLLATHKHN